MKTPDTKNTYYSKGQDITFRMTTPEEEREYFEKARAGEAAEREMKTPWKCLERLSALMKTSYDGAVAREFIIHNHLLFAKMRAEEMVTGGLAPNEVISAANYAVMKAYQSFDHTRGHRFSTYLRSFIRGEIASLWKSKFSGTVPDPSIRGSGQLDDDELAREVATDGVNEAETEDLRAFNNERLAEVLKDLSEKDAELIRLVYVEGMNFADVARERGVSREAVRATHERIMTRLRKSLKGKGVADVL